MDANRLKIRRAPGAEDNTFTRDVFAVLIQRGVSTVTPVPVLFTSDGPGETLGITVGNTQIEIAYEEVQELIDHTRDAYRDMDEDEDEYDGY
jgi:hypothetical protein